MVSCLDSAGVRAVGAGRVLTYLPGNRSMAIRPSARKAVILGASVVAAVYLVYRVVFTLNLTTPYAIFASWFLYVGELYGVMNMLLYFLQVWDASEPPQKPLLPGARTVDVFVPTYNEDPDLLRITLLACQRMDYPHKRIYICDDGKRPAVEALAKELGVSYMIRPDNRHAKAGNLNHAFAKTDGEFIIIFDADHVPDPHFITRLIGYFEDEKLGFVQTPHAFYNFESFQARLNHAKSSYWEEGQLFYHVIQPGRNRWNAPIFAGSAAMFRRRALEEVGYIAVETITEDMHTGLRMHARGWKSLGISERMISGQAAQDVTTFHSQRLRWGEGNLSVLAHDNPLTMRGLTWGQRFCYFATMINWCGGIFKLPIYLTPLLMLFTGVPPVREFNWTLAILMTAYMLCSILGVKYASNGYGSVWYSELFTMASFWTQVRATMRAMFWRKFQKFVVTKKRGRQAKSIWPFVRPQIILIGVSVLALVWAWSRVGMGVSDDPFKPVLATFWASFHVLLAYLVVRRALWPDDRRYSTRHLVHLPISYEAAGAVGGPRRGVGVTMDLNDQGVAFVAYERLAEGAPLRLAVSGAGETIECLGFVKTGRNLVADASAAADAPGGFRYGVAFEKPSDVQKDALNHLCLHYAVPRLYALYGQEHRKLDQTAKEQLTRLFGRRRSTVRHGYRLPVFVRLSDDGPVLPAVTEDISSHALAVVVEQEPAVGGECSLQLRTPLGEATGRGRVLRVAPRRYASRRFFLCIIEFVEFEGGGRIILEAILGRSTGGPLRPVLKPARLPMPVPVNKPLAIGLAAAAVLIVAELGLFRWSYNDDFFLQQVAALQRPLTPDEAAKVDRLYAQTMREIYPSTDRLVLLGRSLQRINRGGELAEVTKVLGPRDRGNLDLQIALAGAYDQREQHDQAEAAYRQLLAGLDSGSVPEGRWEELTAGAARCAVHAGRLDLAAERYRRLLTRLPDHSAYRNEFAGVLLDGGRLEEAAELYDGINPDYEGRVLLVMIHVQAKDGAAAEREARSLLRDNPGDATAEGLLADVLNLRGDYRQARSIYERLLQSNSSDLRLAIQLAHTSLWAKNYQEALERFQAVADQGALEDSDVLRRFPDLPRAYLSAAANAADVSGVKRETVLGLADRALAAKDNDAAFLAQLGWVLHRIGEFDQSSTVLQRALDLDPNDAATRRQLAGVLTAMGKADEALRLLQGRENSLDAHLMMVDAYAAAKDYDSAERECRELLKARPDDLPLRLRLADILSWNKRYPQAIETLEELIQKDPQNPDCAVRLAEVRLWSGDCARALHDYESLLTTDFDRPALWWDFVDAAAGAAEMTDGQVRVALAVADRTRAGEHKSDRVVEAFRKQNRDMAEVFYLTRLAWVMHHHAKDPARAGALLDMVLALHPREPAERKELAGVLAAAGRYPDALRMYDGLALTEQDRLPLARIDAAAQDFDGAAEQCRLVLDKQPLDKEAQSLLADVLSWKGRYSEALELFGQLVRAFPENKDLRRRQAETTLWGGETARALELFQAALKDDPEQPLLRLGFLEAAGRVERLTPEQAATARDITARPIADAPQNVEQMARTAWVKYHSLDDQESGRALARRAAALPSQDAAALARLGWILCEMADKEEAKTVLARAVALNPREPAIRKELAGVLTAAQQFAAARDFLKELVKEDPADASLSGRLAQATLWSGDPAAALALLDKALTANFDQPDLWISYIDAASAVTKGTLTPDQLRIIMRIAERPAPDGAADKPLYLSRLAWVLFREEEKTRAAELLDQAVALHPTDPKTRRELAGVLTAAGKNEAGLRLYEGLTLDLDDRFQLVVLYSAARKFDQAEKQCRAILTGKPSDERARRWLADVLLWSNQPAAAVAAYEQLLAEKFDQAALQPLYIEAAARAETLTAEQTRLAVRIIEDDAGEPQEALPLAHAALVLYRHVEEKSTLPAVGAQTMGLLASPLAPAGCLSAAAVAAERARPTRAKTLLTQALALRPHDPTLLAHLAWIAYQMEEIPQAGRLLDEAIAMRPTAPAVRREVGDALVATQRLGEALPWFEELAAANPNDLELQARLALVTVWSGAYAKGLERLTPLLQRDFQQPALWTAFADAASGAPLMTAEQAELALRIAATPATVRGDDAETLFLSRLAWALLREGQRTKTEAWREEANQLLDRAVKQAAHQPTTRRELAGVLGAAGRFPEALAIYEDLARQYPQDAELRLRLAEATLWSGDYPRAVRRFAELLASDEEQPRSWKGFVDAAAGAPSLTATEEGLGLHLAERPPSFAGADEEAAYLSRLAWVLIRAANKDKPDERWRRAKLLLDRAVGLAPHDSEVRRELAGVSAAAGMSEAGLAMYDGLTLNRDDHLRLADLYAATKRFAEAREECQTVLKEKPNDLRARTRLAKIALWSGDPASALAQLETLLNEDFEQPDLWTAYVDAGAAAPRMQPAQLELASRLAEQTKGASPPSVLFLSRLAWILVREGKAAKDDALLKSACELLDRALALRPQLPGERRELAGVLASAGKNQQALDLLTGLEATDADLSLRASLHAALHDFDVAEKEARLQVERNPDDFEAQYQLANVLSWNKKYDEAERIYRIMQAKSDDPRLAPRLAELALWSGRYDDALDRYYRLLNTDWRRPELWRGYIESASAAPALSSETHKDLILRIYTQAAMEPNLDADYLGRFAWVLRRVDEPKKSVTLLKQAVELQPNSRELRRHLAEALTAAEQYDEAERQYRILLQAIP
jgi:tetratricopeptide (TPR) repeat protein/cellulose synthase/poly-beta-1,6-N-acetylglucosamine synthase-like glycosyltransferase